MWKRCRKTGRLGTVLSGEDGEFRASSKIFPSQGTDFFSAVRLLSNRLPFEQAKSLCVTLRTEMKQPEEFVSRDQPLHVGEKPAIDCEPQPCRGRIFRVFFQLFCVALMEITYLGMGQIEPPGDHRF